MSTRVTRATTLTLMLVSVLAQDPAQTTTHNRVRATSSATSAALTASIVPSTSSVATETSESEVHVHLVKAGPGGFHFDPKELTNVSVGDIVTFEFYPPDHSVARAEYGSACVPYEYTGKDKVGFWSETQWVDTPSDITHWNLTINSTEPIFYYCAAPDSCRGKQMVGAINANDTQTLHAQELAAAKAEFQLAPGEPMPNEASSTSTPSPAASSHRNLASIDDQSATLSAAAIAGITICGIVILALFAGIFFYLARKGRSKRQERSKLQTTYIQHNPGGEYPNSVLSPLPPLYQSVLPDQSVSPAELCAGEKRHA
ncbi:hypothetical protein L13192_09501 [Pyrenophora tritici-repentis]|nr:hypothetical protein L13192_09501 [Pyrenophora tritici-repentis]